MTTQDERRNLDKADSLLSGGYLGGSKKRSMADPDD